MKQTKHSATQKGSRSEPVDIQIEVDDFGPIGSGKVQLRPLTVFVGPSNAGKTYLAVLVYALHKALGGLSKYAILSNSYFSVERIFLRYFSDKTASDTRKSEKEIAKTIENIAAKLRDQTRPFTFFDLPAEMRESALSALTDSELLADDLGQEVERCFDLQSLSEMVRYGSKNGETKISVSARQDSQTLWNFDVQFSASGISSQGMIGDINLGENADRSPDLRARFRQLELLFDDQTSQRMYRVFSDLAKARENEAYYLPAARSGIMQSHRVIASSLMGRATRAGLERLPELPTFSGVLVDFMQRLILHGERVVPWRLRRPQKHPNVVTRLADSLEQQTLGGRIRVVRPLPGGYPEFVYEPHNTKQKIGLSRASSMVTELAPVVLCLRDGLGEGDTVIIEEPEAHLHPAAQTQMANTLAQLVNAGVRVIVTTHSDWLLKAIGNLMREGALAEGTDPEATAVELDYPTTAIRPKDAGIWLFRKSRGQKGSTMEEIPFDSVNGVEPSDYDIVDEELYNRSAELQNQLEEGASGGND